MGKKFIEIIKKKWLTSILLTVLLFAIIICAYLGLTYLVKKVNITDLDFTEDKIYSISQETKDKLKNLDQNVTITVYKMYEYVNDFTNKYAALNKNIKVEMLENLNSKTQWKTEYGLDDNTSFIMVQSESKSKLLYEYNLYTYNYTTGAEVIIVEEAITNAILDVITNTKPKICFVTGHNLYPNTYFQYLETALTSEMNEITYIDLLKTGSVPEDCSLLVLTTLKNDITEKERDEILKYIKNGGEILLLLDPNLNKIKTPNFQKVLNEYGVTNSEGIILEGNSNNMMSGAPNFIISTINSSSEIIKNANMEISLCMLNSGKLSFASSEELDKKNVTMQAIATTSDKAFYRTDLNSNSFSKIKSDEDAANSVVAAMLTKTIDENKVSKLIVFANTVFATNTQIPISSQYYMYAINAYNNEDILLNSVSYLTGRENNITIRKNPETVTTYDVTVTQERIVTAIIYGIPVAIIVLGIVIWQIRRRKK